MWPLPTIKNEHIQVVLHQNNISICWIKPAISYPAKLQMYEQYEIPMSDSVLMYNSTALRDCIRAFAHNHNLHDAYISFILGTDLIEEQIIKHAKSDPTSHELIGQKEKHKRYYDRYIGPYENHYLFYVCTAAHPLILQLQMLNMQLPLHVHHISPPLSVQITLYKHLHKDTFNQARLAQEVNQNDASIPSIFSLEFLRRCLKTDRPVTHDDLNLFYALGSFFGAQI
jgi:hypothetical protein